MNKDIHQNPDRWPIPLGNGLLVEVDNKRSDSNILMPNQDVTNLNSGTVRVTSKTLADTYKEVFLPEGKGSLGRRIIFPKGAVVYLDDHGKDIYEELGFVRPDSDENDYGQLVMLDMRRVVGLLPEDGSEGEGSPPFKPWGSLIFLEFEYDDESVNAVGLKTGKTYGPEDEPEDEILVPESSRAAEENIATVTKVGDGEDQIEPGMRVIPSVRLESITYKEVEYPFVSSSKQLHAIV